MSRAGAVALGTLVPRSRLARRRRAAVDHTQGGEKNDQACQQHQETDYFRSSETKSSAKTPIITKPKARNRCSVNIGR
jgi:hypothetical protein